MPTKAENPDNAAQVDRRVVIVAGPTASGKSALALELARAFDGEIINADSMQVYRDLQVLTARPNESDMAQAPHRLYGLLDGTERCSAGRWQVLALEAIEACLAAGRLPLVVGGTGLYLRALTEGLSAIPPVPVEDREAIAQRLSREGAQALHDELQGLDPRAAAAIHPHDGQRISRALEVFRATGKPLSHWQAQRGEKPAGLTFRTITLLPPRDLLRERSDRRFLAMMEAGALAEVEKLLARGLAPDLPVMKSLGVPDLIGYLEARLSLEEAVERAQAKTRQYAKRQVTWLRTQLLRNEDDDFVINAQYSESLLPKIFKNLRLNPLTRPQ